MVFLLDYLLLYFGSIFIIVFIHEFGHYIVARLCNVRVISFSIGFGAELIGFTSRSGTRWKVSAVPLGGYVRFSEDDQDVRSFVCATSWKKILIILAGPFANCVMAILISTFFFYKTGMIESVIFDVYPNSPAAISGVKAGDRIVSLDEMPVSTFDDIAPYIRENVSKEIVVGVHREYVGMLRLKVVPSFLDFVDRFGVKRRIPSIGISFNYDKTRLQYRTVSQSFLRGLKEMGLITQRTLSVLSNIFSRDIKSQISGPIGIAKAAKDFSDQGFDSYIGFISFFSWMAGFMNLLPIPILDGGNVVIFILEMIRRKPLEVAVARVITGIGICIILVLFMLGIRNDIYGLIK